MSYTIIDSTETELPVKRNGEPYLHAIDMTGETMLADTLGECIGFFIQNYDKIAFTDEGDDEALFARADAAVHYANVTQQAFIEHVGIPDGLTESERLAIVSDRSVPVEVEGNWDHDIPLVLVSTDYAPYTNLEAPTGDVMFINPHTELSLLISGSEIGLWKFYTRAKGLTRS